MTTSFVIVDDFLANAAALRQTALGLTYPDLQGTFPGRNSLERINIEGLAEETSRLVGEPLKPISPLESHGHFRLALAGDKGRARVHVDHSHWSGILFLSRPEDCRGGTEFFRHRATGTDRVPDSPEAVRALGFDSYEAMHREIMERDSLDDSAWEMIMQVPMRFNRLVLLRPWLWHTAGPPFGDQPENGRLVYLMFFDSAR